MSNLSRRIHQYQESDFGLPNLVMLVDDASLFRDKRISYYTKFSVLPS